MYMCVCVWTRARVYIRLGINKGPIVNKRTDEKHIRKPTGPTVGKNMDEKPQKL